MGKVWRLNNPGFFEDTVSTAFIDSLPGLSGESQGQSFLEFGHIEALFLEIGVLPDHAGGVKLGSTSAVGVAASNSRALL